MSLEYIPTKLKDSEIEKIEFEELEKIYLELKEDYINYLEKYKVKFPSYLKNKNKFSKKALQLIFLKKHELKLVHKDQVSEFVSFYEKCKDIQVRHLGSQSGWNILNKGEKIDNFEIPSGYHILVSTKRPKSGYNQSKRELVLNAKDFEDIKKAYDFKCATCGSKEGQKHRYKENIVKLQKSHIDPNKELSNDNAIPQCQFCNQQYKDNFIFDEEGMIRKLNNLNLLKKSSDDFKREALRYLQEEFLLKKTNK